MATTTASAHSVRGVTEAPRGSLRFDWAMIVLCGWFVGGIYLDGWAHNNLPQLETFFTPWHAVLYTGFFASAGFLGLTLLRSFRAGHRWPRVVPAGYELSLLGTLVFLAGGVGDMLWHELFGIEQDVEALLSPTHLMLAIGAALIVSGPLRAAWQQGDADRQARRASTLLPAIVSATFLLSLLTFMSQFAHPLVHTRAFGAGTGPKLDSELYVMNADGSRQMRLTTNPGTEDTHASWSPDRTRIAFSSGRENSLDIYVMQADGANVTRLTTDGAENVHPAWSPDGSKIAFVSRRDGESQLYVMASDGSSQTRLTDGGVVPWRPAWSPDGRRIAFSSTQTGDEEVFVVNADGSGLTRLTNSLRPDAHPSWSLDGRWLVFTSARTGDGDLYLMNNDGDGLTRLTSHPSRDWLPVWSPAGDRIAYVSLRDENSEIYVMNADGSNPINLTNNPGLDESFPAWSPDGRQIVFSTQGHDADSASLQHAYGVAGILLQAALLIGTILLLLHRWSTLPFGSLTLLVTLNTTLVSLMNDHAEFIPVGLLAGLTADLLLRLRRPAPERMARYRLLAFVVPVTLYGLYFLVLALEGNLGWSIHLWLGAIILAGVVGLLISYLLRPPAAAAR